MSSLPVCFFAAFPQSLLPILAHRFQLPVAVALSLFCAHKALVDQGCERSNPTLLDALATADPFRRFQHPVTVEHREPAEQRLLGSIQKS